MLRWSPPKAPRLDESLDVLGDSSERAYASSRGRSAVKVAAVGVENSPRSGIAHEPVHVTYGVINLRELYIRKIGRAFVPDFRTSGQ